MQHEVINGYFEWMSDIVCTGRFGKGNSFRKLLMQLHGMDFRFYIPMDENRAEDGISLRYRYAMRVWGNDDVCEYLQRPCSVLEMMVALALRCEECIMDDGKIGNRTAQWFWNMVTNLGLGSMTDENFDKDYVIFVINRFLDRKYEFDGKGGLFRVRNSDSDLRKVEIWCQLCWYLDSIT